MQETWKKLNRIKTITIKIGIGIGSRGSVI